MLLNRTSWSIATLIFLIGIESNSQNHEAFIDSVHSEINKVKADSSKTNIYYDSGVYAFEPLNDMDLSKKYIDSALSYSRRAKRKDLEGLCFLMYGLIDRFKGDYQRALESLATSKSLLGEFKKYRNYPMFQIASIHSNQGNYEEGLKIFYEISETFEQEKDSFALASALNSIGTLYYTMEEKTEALNYFNKSLKLFQELDAKRDVANMYRNIGDFYLNNKDTVAAIGYFNNSLEIANEIKENYAIGYSLYYLGVSYSNSSPSKGLEYLLEAEQIIANGNYKKLLAGIRTALGNHQKNIDKPNTAINYYMSALELSEELELDWRQTVFDGLSSVHKQIGNYELAYEFLEKKVKLKDSLLNLENLKTINLLKTQFETEKKENELLKLNKEKQENDLVIAKQRRRVQQLSFGLGGLALLGILGFLLFKQRLQNKKQEELLLAISETQTEERKRIAQDLHDSIGGLLALTKSKFETVKNNLKPPSDQMDMALATLEQTTKQVRQISHNLMPGELVRFGLVAAINTLLENINEEEINAQFHSNLNDDRMEPLKEIQLYRIVQEAIQNVLKHAKAKSLTLQLNKHKDYFSLMIEDDGEGITGASSEGMGLKNIRQRVQLLKGAFTVDTSPKQGTTLNIQIPV